MDEFDIYGDMDLTTAVDGGGTGAEVIEQAPNAPSLPAVPQPAGPLIICSGEPSTVAAEESASTALAASKASPAEQPATVAAPTLQQAVQQFQDAQLKQLQNQISDMQQQLQQLRSLHKEATDKVSQLELERATLVTNISVLYRTAVCELDRKNQDIKQLRSQVGLVSVPAVHTQQRVPSPPAMHVTEPVSKPHLPVRRETADRDRQLTGKQQARHTGWSSGHSTERNTTPPPPPDLPFPPPPPHLPPPPPQHTSPPPPPPPPYLPPPPVPSPPTMEAHEQAPRAQHRSTGWARDGRDRQAGNSSAHGQADSRQPPRGADHIRREPPHSSKRLHASHQPHSAGQHSVLSEHQPHSSVKQQHAPVDKKHPIPGREPSPARKRPRYQDKENQQMAHEAGKGRHCGNKEGQHGAERGWKRAQHKLADGLSKKQQLKDAERQPVQATVVHPVQEEDREEGEL